jgi:hypothetical protein
MSGKAFLASVAMVWDNNRYSPAETLFKASSCEKFREVLVYGRTCGLV